MYSNANYTPKLPFLLVTSPPNYHFWMSCPPPQITVFCLCEISTSSFFNFLNWLIQKFRTGLGLASAEPALPSFGMQGVVLGLFLNRPANFERRPPFMWFLFFKNNFGFEPFTSVFLLFLPVHRYPHPRGFVIFTNSHHCDYKQYLRTTTITKNASEQP